MGKIKIATNIKRKELKEQSPEFINTNNKVINVLTGEVLEQSPATIFFNKVETDYDQNADCPLIREFIDGRVSESDALTIKKVAGFCLYREYFIKKAIILVGPSDTGKTTFLTLLAKLIGEDNISGVSLQRISSDKFAGANMHNKLANIYDELSSKDIDDTGSFKIATGAGYMTSEKKFGNQFRFINHAKLIFACNTIPPVNDTDDEAYFKRWIIIKFNKLIKHKDPNLLKRLMTKSEMSGFLNYAIEGLKMLLEDNLFGCEKDPNEVKNEMLRSSSSVLAFCMDCVVEAPKGVILKSYIHEEYIEYCKNSGLGPYGIKKFGKELQKFMPIINSNPINGVEMWANIMLKRDMTEEEQTNAIISSLE